MTHFIEPDKTHLTIKPGMGAGSPRYMAPELYNKDRESEGPHQFRPHY